MNSGKSLLEPGFILYYLFLAAGTFILFLTEKGEFLIWLNSHHTTVFDIFFKYWTHLGDGLIFAALIVFFLLTSYFRAILLIIAVITQTVMVQGLKRFVFDEIVRPGSFFSNFESFHHVSGVEIHHFNSFPSGHTATAFTVAVLLSLFYHNRYLTVVLMSMAILVGLSRIYLLQHFYIDVYFGSVIGFLNACLVYYWVISSPKMSGLPVHKGLLHK